MSRKQSAVKVRANYDGYLKMGYVDFYRWYRKSSSAPVDKTIARQILRRTFDKCWEKIISDYWVMRFPYGLGHLYVSESSSLVKNSYKDWSRTAKGGRLKWAYCHDTDGRKPYIKYTRVRGPQIKYGTVYKFKPIRGEKNKLRGFKGLWGYIKDNDLKAYRPNIM